MTLDYLRVETVGNEHQALVIVAACREQRHLEHVLPVVLFVEFNAFPQIKSRLLELNIINKLLEQLTLHGQPG